MFVKIITKGVEIWIKIKMENEFEVINDENELLERLNHRQSFNTVAMYSTVLDGYTSDINKKYKKP
jgi:hypothetical protein